VSIGEVSIWCFFPLKFFLLCLPSQAVEHFQSFCALIIDPLHPLPIQQEIKSAKELHAKAKEELTKLKSAETNNKKRREAVMKEMEKGVKDAQKVSNALRAELVTFKNKRDAVQAELKACNAELITVKEQRQISESAVARLTEELEALNLKVFRFFSILLSSLNLTDLFLVTHAAAANQGRV